MIDYDVRVCQTNVDAPLYGLCDDDSKSPAFVSLNPEGDEWLCEVINTQGKLCRWTAIDNCIEILRDDGSMESRCDGMITYEDNIIFVELKKVRKSWIPDGVEQLKISVQLFFDHNQIEQYRKKQAILSNRSHPSFHFNQVEAMQRFKNETGVRLLIVGTIHIK